jgi:hypothetical protein
MDCERHAEGARPDALDRCFPQPSERARKLARRCRFGRLAVVSAKRISAPAFHQSERLGRPPPQSLPDERGGRRARQARACFFTPSSSLSLQCPRTCTSGDTRRLWLAARARPRSLASEAESRPLVERPGWAASGGVGERKVRDQTPPMCLGLELGRQPTRVDDHAVDLDKPRKRVVIKQLATAELDVHTGL